MVAVSAFSPISPEDYLATEVTSSTKHEYRDGHLYAMAGGTDAHINITCPPETQPRRRRKGRLPTPQGLPSGRGEVFKPAPPPEEDHLQQGDRPHHPQAGNVAPRPL